MRVLGIDPGSHITGYGIVESSKDRLIHVSHGSIAAVVKTVRSSESGVGRKIKDFEPLTPNSDLLSRRLHAIYGHITKILLEFKPDAVAVEEIFYAKNARSAIMLGHARGVAILCAGQHNLPVFEYSPMKIKQAVVGYGNATKEQVQKMIKALLKMSSVPKTDASDALAAAICHIHHHKIKVQYRSNRLRSSN